MHVYVYIINQYKDLLIYTVQKCSIMGRTIISVMMEAKLILTPYTTQSFLF